MRSYTYVSGDKALGIPVFPLPTLSLTQEAGIQSRVRIKQEHFWIGSGKNASSHARDDLWNGLSPGTRSERTE